MTAPNEPTPATTPARRIPPLTWVTTLYYAEGFPYALVNNVAEVLFKDLGASVQAIGLTSAFHLPWNLKFLWAPVLDRHETKRSFILGCEWLVLAITVVLALLGATMPMVVAAVVFVALAFVAATHDVAIDGYYLEALDRDEQSKYVGLRAAAYRGAVLVASGPMLVIAGFAGWHAAWWFAVAVAVAMLFFHRHALPDVEPRGVPLRVWLSAMARPRRLIMLAVVGAAIGLERTSGLLDAPLAWLRERIAAVPLVGSLGFGEWIGVALLLVAIPTMIFLGRVQAFLRRRNSSYARAFVDFLEHPQIPRALALILLFRTGESFLMKMRLPFLRDACGLSLEAYGVINGTLGFIATMIGTLLGGYLIAKHGLRRWLWPMVFAQNLPNLLYVLLAAVGDPSQVAIEMIASVVILEDLGAGLGTSVFMIYIMRCCDPRHKATHMAVLTAVMSIGFTVAGMGSGYLVARMGFTNFFLLSFLATIPSMLLLPFAPFLDRGRGDEAAHDAPPRPADGHPTNP